MAPHPVIVLVLVFAVVSRVGRISATHVLKGSVTCLDCGPHPYDLSDIKVLVKCNQVKKLALATTEKNGYFESQLPSDTTASPSSLQCAARLLGGPKQIYASRKNLVSVIVRTQEPGSYTISKPLYFYTSSPKVFSNDIKPGHTQVDFGSAKTVDLPVPKEWGLAPTSYYVPFIPIIGIP